MEYDLAGGGAATTVPDQIFVVKFVVNEGFEHRCRAVTWDDVS